MKTVKVIACDAINIGERRLQLPSLAAYLSWIPRLILINVTVSSTYIFVFILFIAQRLHSYVLYSSIVKQYPDSASLVLQMGNCFYWGRTVFHGGWFHDSCRRIRNLCNSLVDAASAMVGPRSWLGGLFYRSGNKRHSSGEKTVDYTMTPLQVSWSYDQYVILCNSFFIEYGINKKVKALTGVIQMFHTNYSIYTNTNNLKKCEFFFPDS